MIMNRKYIIMVLLVILIFNLWIISLNSYKNYLIENIKIDGINEGYKGQVVLNIEGKYYEYEYNYKGEF